MAHLRINIEVHTIFIFYIWDTVLHDCLFPMPKKAHIIFLLALIFIGCKLSITLDMRHNTDGALTNE